MKRRSVLVGRSACAKALWQEGTCWEGGNNEVQTFYLPCFKPELSQCSSWQVMLGSRGVGFSKPSCPWSFMFPPTLALLIPAPDSEYKAAGEELQVASLLSPWGNCGQSWQVSCQNQPSPSPQNNSSAELKLWSRGTSFLSPEERTVPTCSPALS